MTANYTFEWRISTCSFHTTFCRLKTRNTTLSIFIEQRIRGEPNQLFFLSYLLCTSNYCTVHIYIYNARYVLYTLHAITMKRRIASIRLFNYITERISTKFQDWTNIWRVKLETNESETRRSGMERARRGRKYVQFRERWKYPRFHHSGNEDRNAFSSFSFSLFFSSTLLVNRDGTNLIGKSSGFPNPGIFREQIQLDVDRSNSKLLPFSLSATGFYPAREGRRRRRRGESTAVARISTWVNRNRVKRRKIRISTVFRESSCAYSFLSSNISSMSISSHR